MLDWLLERLWDCPCVANDLVILRESLSRENWMVMLLGKL